MTVKSVRTLLAACLISTGSTAFGAEPGFECRAQQAIAEHLICGSSELAKLDRELNSVFKEAMRATTLNKDKNKRIRDAQKAWLKRRNACEYGFDCIATSYKDRMLGLQEYLTRETFSWGGKLRAGPSVYEKDLGSTKQRQPITIIENSGVMFNEYPWFKVEVDGKTAYQWGGIICDSLLREETYCE